MSQGALGEWFISAACLWVPIMLALVKYMHGLFVVMCYDCLRFELWFFSKFYLTFSSYNWTLSAKFLFLIEKHENKMKNAGIKGGAFNFICEIYFSLSIFFCYELIGPFNCLKIHFGMNIYFHCFSIFLIGGEIGVFRFWRKEIFFIGDNLTTKQVKNSINMFY